MVLKFFTFVRCARTSYLPDETDLATVTRCGLLLASVFEKLSRVDHVPAPVGAPASSIARYWKSTVTVKAEKLPLSSVRYNPPGKTTSTSIFVVVVPTAFAVNGPAISKSDSFVPNNSIAETSADVSTLSGKSVTGSPGP